MSPITARIGVTLSIGLLLLAAACSDTRKESVPFNSETGKHPTNWNVPTAHGATAKASTGFNSCQTCHGSDFAGGVSSRSCLNTAGCHGATVSAPHSPIPWRGGARTHTDTNTNNAPVCALCHTNGQNLVSIPAPTPPPPGTPPGCFNSTLCHGPAGHAAGWANPDTHGAAAKSAPNATAMQGFSTCQACHGANFGGDTATTCFTCHGVSAPHAFPWQSTSTRKHSTTDVANASSCGLCHLANRQPPSYVVLTVPVGCFDNTLCHGQAGHPAGWLNPDTHGAAAKSAPSATAMQGFSTCQACHGANFAGDAATTCFTCHGVSAPHAFPWQSTSARKHSTTDVANAAVCGLCHWNNVQPPTYSTPVPGTPNCFDNTLCHG